MNTVRKISGYLLLALVLLTTILALLGIWEIIDLRKVLTKTLSSLMVVFASSAVVLFIYAVILNFREDKEN